MNHSFCHLVVKLGSGLVEQPPPDIGGTIKPMASTREAIDESAEFYLKIIADQSVIALFLPFQNLIHGVLDTQRRGL